MGVGLLPHGPVHQTKHLILTHAELRCDVQLGRRDRKVEPRPSRQAHRIPRHVNVVWHTSRERGDDRGIGLLPNHGGDGLGGRELAFRRDRKARLYDVDAQLCELLCKAVVAAYSRSGKEQGEEAQRCSTLSLHAHDLGLGGEAAARCLFSVAQRGIQDLNASRGRDERRE